ncbi:MAG: hypothetical protein ACXVK3_04605 [Candidatus Angelobacter sp.]
MIALERTTLDFRFESDLSLVEMKRALSVPGREEWVFGDSEWHGDYLGGSITPEAVARIYATRRTTLFHVSLRFVTSAAETNAVARMREAAQTLLGQILPAIHARNIKPVEPLG